MKSYTIGKLAKLADISVRTLHHYDQIGLLCANRSSDNGYRLYDQTNLEELQQILFLRELDFSLSEIGKIIRDPEYDRLEALSAQKNFIQSQIERKKLLLQTIQKSIWNLKGEGKTMTAIEMFKGFSKEKADTIRDAISGQYHKNINKLTTLTNMGECKDKTEEAKQIGVDLAYAMMEVRELPPEHEKVQTIINTYQDWIRRYYPTKAEVYQRLAENFESYDEFNKYFEVGGEGLDHLLTEAWKVFIQKEK
jgi:DNA-binding transcriptional MerR regulator